jgi:serpin B
VSRIDDPAEFAGEWMSMRFRYVALGLLATGIVTAGCGGASSPGVPGDAGGIDVDLIADVTGDDEQAVGDAVNAFGFDLLRQIGTDEENVVTSPVSVSALLAMILAGAGSDTAEAMAAVLHLEESRDVRVGGLLRRLSDTDDVTFSVANALWAREGTPFEEDYFDFVTGAFGATVEETDLGSQETADEIDAWVDDRTEGLIDEIAEDLGLPSGNAVLVLLNAVYFLGEWTTQFDPDDTADETFAVAGGDRADVATMHLRDVDFDHVQRDGYRMLRMPYGDDGRFGMEILLPDEGSSVGGLLDALDHVEWRAAVESLAESTFDDVAMPRFELEWDMTLNDPLTALGMGIAFDGASDFLPMSPTDPYLDIVVHKTFIRVDESGTEAAAVTGGVMADSAAVEPNVFRVDRPFVFTISDQETGAVLFLGAVADPRG